MATWTPCVDLSCGKVCEEDSKSRVEHKERLNAATMGLSGAVRAEEGRALLGSRLPQGFWQGVRMGGRGQRGSSTPGMCQGRSGV